MFSLKITVTVNYQTSLEKIKKHKVINFLSPSVLRNSH